MTDIEDIQGTRAAIERRFSRYGGEAGYWEAVYAKGAETFGGLEAFKAHVDTLGENEWHDLLVDLEEALDRTHREDSQPVRAGDRLHLVSTGRPGIGKPD